MNTSWLRRRWPTLLGLASLTLELSFPSKRKIVELALLIGAVLWAIFHIRNYMEMTRGMIIGMISATALCAVALAFIWQFLPMQIMALVMIALLIVAAFAFVAVEIADLLGDAVEKPPLKR